MRARPGCNIALRQHPEEEWWWVLVTRWGFAGDRPRASPQRNWNCTTCIAAGRAKSRRDAKISTARSPQLFSATRGMRPEFTRKFILAPAGMPTLAPRTSTFEACIQYIGNWAPPALGAGWGRLLSAPSFIIKLCAKHSSSGSAGSHTHTACASQTFAFFALWLGDLIDKEWRVARVLSQT